MVHPIIKRARHLRHASIEHERLTSLINSMADGVITVSSNMNIILSNGAALNILDVNDTLINKRLHEVFHVIDKNNQAVPIEKLIQNAKIPTATRDLLIAYADGSKINLYMSIAPVRLGYGRRGGSGWVILIRDITHEKSLEEERDEFISVVSHELRTPIAITEGNISNAQFIAEKTGDMEKIKAALQQAHDQVMFLASMVNDLATLSRAERGKLVVEVQPIDVSALIESLAKLYSSDAAKKGLKLLTRATPHISLMSSDLYVREILQNFITNAIKYTDEGSVTIAAEPADKGVRFSVQDTGIGISKQDQERVFDKFFRSEDFRTRKANGTGLGLYVTLKLARLVHAEMDVQSELNKGSTFTIFIPNLQ